MAAASLSFSCLPFDTKLCLPRQTNSQVRRSFFPAYAAGGKGFGELLRQRKNKSQAQEFPDAPLSSGLGFGGKRISKQNDKSDASLDPSVHSEDEQTVCSCSGGDNKLSYTDCCMPYHQGNTSAPDGLSLLRARYSAYARGIVGYIVRTTHPENPDYGDDLLANAQATCDQLRFYKLEILQYEPISDQESTVSFRAIYGRKKKGKGDRRVMEEKSYFVREGDTWLFKNGEVLNRALKADLVAASAANNAGKS